MSTYVRVLWEDDINVAGEYPLQMKEMLSKLRDEGAVQMIQHILNPPFASKDCASGRPLGTRAELSTAVVAKAGKNIVRSVAAVGFGNDKYRSRS